MNSQTEQEREWRFYIDIEVRFADIDMFGHVNNATYLTYIETARVAYYTAVTGLTEPREFGMTLASATVDFLKPLFFGQSLRVAARTVRIGNKSWTLEHELCNLATGELLATASTVIVHYDYGNGRSMIIPEEIVSKLAAFEGRTLKARAPL